MSVVRFCCDDETGEIVTYKINEETGEPSMEQSVPCSTVNPRRYKQEDNKKHSVQFRKGYSTNKKKFQTLKASIMAGSNTISHRLLLLPTLTFFPSYITVVLVILEVYLHIRCHNKNKLMSDQSLYYRSPFHVVSSIFCGACRDVQSADKVGHMQDKRRYKYDYLKSIPI